MAPLWFHIFSLFHLLAIVAELATVFVVTDDTPASEKELNAAKATGWTLVGLTVLYVTAYAVMLRRGDI